MERFIRFEPTRLSHLSRDQFKRPVYSHYIDSRDLNSIPGLTNNRHLHLHGPRDKTGEWLQRHIHQRQRRNFCERYQSQLQQLPWRFRNRNGTEHRYLCMQWSSRTDLRDRYQPQSPDMVSDCDKYPDVVINVVHRLARRTRGFGSTAPACFP